MYCLRKLVDFWLLRPGSRPGKESRISDKTNSNDPLYRSHIRCRLFSVFPGSRRENAPFSQSPFLRYPLFDVLRHNQPCRLGYNVEKEHPVYRLFATRTDTIRKHSQRGKISDALRREALYLAGSYRDRALMDNDYAADGFARDMELKHIYAEAEKRLK